MANAVGNVIKHAWNIFLNRDPTVNYTHMGGGTTYRPDRSRVYMGSERTIVTSIYNRIAIDVASTLIQHVKVNDAGQFLEVVDSDLNRALNIEANIDQTGTSLIQDLAFSLLDEGCVAVVPTLTNMDPSESNAYKIYNMRVGSILEWYPTHVRVRLYNEKTGLREDYLLPKKTVAIIENPLYEVMNEPNSTLKRLTNKLQLLDAVDQQSASGKLDIIIQLPYTVKREKQKELADKRLKEIEMQMTDAQYGIAYIDGTEKITQLNRPAENNLMDRIEYLTSMLHSQLGMTESVFDGTADAAVMLNYYNRTVDPILVAIVNEFRRKFLTKTARSQNHDIRYFRSFFKHMSVSDLAENADKLTRNEILSSNEFRAILGYKPHPDPKADKLENKNIARKGDTVSNDEPSNKE